MSELKCQMRRMLVSTTFFMNEKATKPPRQIYYLKCPFVYIFDFFLFLFFIADILMCNCCHASNRFQLKSLAQAYVNVQNKINLIFYISV